MKTRGETEGIWKVGEEPNQGIDWFLKKGCNSQVSEESLLPPVHVEDTSPPVVQFPCILDDFCVSQHLCNNAAFKKNHPKFHVLELPCAGVSQHS